VGQVPPLAAGPHEVDYGVYDLAEVHATSATTGLGRRDQGSDASPLGIGKVGGVRFPNHPFVLPANLPSHTGSETCRDIARLHLLPSLGNFKLKDLTRENVQKLHAHKRESGLSKSVTMQMGWSSVAFMLENYARFMPGWGDDGVMDSAPS
jgi:hypothetical protein